MDHSPLKDQVLAALVGTGLAIVLLLVAIGIGTWVTGR